ncbi:MAG: hypothetical protein Greene071421_137 [Parcubacteria group bacterium Greene0714_21]|nr:MAG: hypothetical protein Greene041639_215 [Parcubacteria group bacterium Greene0416_39]TSC98540.1 MAG: hypothetical protein Greene101447_42 [Parcubacteria group bacterium Greene1014_47]TSD04301.1 MAG: hypothetical protein Greene071421_137 [Parcubacteria group bacterium Greene0714_21]
MTTLLTIVGVLVGILMITVAFLYNPKPRKQ